MKQKLHYLAIAALICAFPAMLGLATPARADNVDWNNVPENIQRTIMEADGNRQPEAIELKNEDGKMVYQATVLDPAGLRRIVRTDAEGHLLAEEERQPGHDVNWDNVPPMAKQAILNQSQHLKLEDVENQQVGGAQVFVAEFERPDGSKLLISVTPTGQILGEKSRSANY